MANHILWLDDGHNAKEMIPFLPGDLYQVEWVSSPEHAFSLLGHSSFDVLVTDVYTPQDDGAAFIRQVMEDHPGISCIALYDAPDGAAALAALRAGATEVLQQPISGETLLFTLEKTAERRRQAKDSQNAFQRLQEQLDKTTQDLEKANRHLQRMRHYLENLLNSSVDSVLTTSTDLHITYVNQGAIHMLGYLPSLLMGVPLEKLLRGRRGSDTATTTASGQRSHPKL